MSFCEETCGLDFPREKRKIFLSRETYIFKPAGAVRRCGTFFSPVWGGLGPLVPEGPSGVSQIKPALVATLVLGRAFFSHFCIARHCKPFLSRMSTSTSGFDPFCPRWFLRMPQCGMPNH